MMRPKDQRPPRQHWQRPMSNPSRRHGGGRSSLLSPALKKDILDEKAKMQKTFDKVYKDFYKTQQPKRGRKAKA